MSCVNALGKRVAYNSEEPSRLISFNIPEERAEQCWVKRAALKINKDGTAVVAAAVDETYTANPTLIKFENSAGTVAEETLFLLKDTKTVSDEQNVQWYNVKIGTLKGWIAENDSGIKKLSAFDWPGFRIAKEEGETAYDPVIDFKNLSPFFKKIVDEINTFGGVGCGDNFNALACSKFFPAIDLTRRSRSSFIFSSRFITISPV